MSEGKHAKLSASGSHRWILCPGSVQAESGLPETSSKYADEGILAHKVAAAILAPGAIQDKNELVEISNVPEEMRKNVLIYTDYVQNLFTSNKNTSHVELHVEKKVNFSHIVPGGFGTADALIYSIEDNKLTVHIVDLKYGQGVKEQAKDNTQLILYALGATRELTFDPYQVVLHIVQPRINNIDSTTLESSELSRWKTFLREKALAALAEDAPRVPSMTACRWCKASNNCDAIFQFTVQNTIDKMKHTLSNIEEKLILDNSKLITKFVKDIEQKVYSQLEMGEPFPGYKLVAGKSVRKLYDDAEEKLVELLGEKAYNKSPLGILELEKLLDKETLASLVYFSDNRPQMVPEDDRRQALVLEELKFDPV